MPQKAETIENKAVAALLDTYPADVRAHMLALRALIYQLAHEAQAGAVEESLKWGEAAYRAPKGSTVRMAWKSETPDVFGLYFICTTSLLDTFKMLYGDLLRFKGNRAILLQADAPLPIEELKTCLTLALTYHQRKHLPLLGARPA